MKAKTFNRWHMIFTITIALIVGCILAAYSDGGVIGTPGLKLKPVSFSDVHRGFKVIDTDRLGE